MNPALRQLADRIMAARAEQADAELAWEQAVNDGDTGAVARAEQRRRALEARLMNLQGAVARMVVELSERTG